MKFKLYRNHGALNSPQIFDAFADGLKILGHTEVTENEDISVIWSVLWKGRMRPNKDIYHYCIQNNKKILIIEVGNLKRNVTWRLSFNHVNASGVFANKFDLDPDRPKKLGIHLYDYNFKRRDEILVCTQLPESLQWHSMPATNRWLEKICDEIRTYSDRKIIVRPHPRSYFRERSLKYNLQMPNKIVKSYDDFDIDFNYHCVINHNSGPTIQAIIKGTPIICDDSSLAFGVSNKFKDIENLQFHDREDWFLSLCHTEWTVDELRSGEALGRLLKHI